MGSTKNRPGQRRRLLFISVAILLITIGATAWILKTNEIISNLGAVFTILGVLLAFIHEDPSSAHSVSTSSTNSMNQKQHQVNGYAEIEIEGITSAVLGLTKKGMGALLVYANSPLCNSPIDLTFGFGKPSAEVDIVERVARRRKNNRTVFVAIFRELPAGSYTVCSDVLGLKEKVTIHASEVTEIDWRQKVHRRIAHQRHTDIGQVRSNNEV